MYITKKWRTSLAAASDKVDQLLAHCRWFSPGMPSFSTTEAGRHNTAEILQMVALNTKNLNHHKSKEKMFFYLVYHKLQYPLRTLHWLSENTNI
jgi:hypothetical protein